MVFKISVALLVLATTISAASVKRVACPDGVHSASNEACCVFFSLADELQTSLFNNECGDGAHGALRLTFHDAVGFSKSGALKGTGADGSIIIFEDSELADPANLDVTSAVESLKPFLQQFDVSAGDLIQFAGAVGVSNCPGAPRLQFLAGRPNATIPAQQGSVPPASDSASAIFARLADVGFSLTEVVSLLGAHSVATAGTDNDLPLDITPTKFDTQFYLDVLLKGVGFPPGSNPGPSDGESPLPSQEARLQSDFAISRDNTTACAWQNMINNQALLQSGFQGVMAKLAVVGQAAGSLIDCSEAVPTPLPLSGSSAFFPPGTSIADVQQVCPSPFPSVGSNCAILRCTSFKAPTVQRYLLSCIESHELHHTQAMYHDERKSNNDPLRTTSPPPYDTSQRNGNGYNTSGSEPARNANAPEPYPSTYSGPSQVEGSNTMASYPDAHMSRRQQGYSSSSHLASPGPSHGTDYKGKSSLAGSTDIPLPQQHQGHNYDYARTTDPSKMFKYQNTKTGEFFYSPHPLNHANAVCPNGHVEKSVFGFIGIAMTILFFPFGAVFLYFDREVVCRKCSTHLRGRTWL